MVKPRDERIAATADKIGHESFILVLLFCGVLIVVRQFFLDQHPGTESYILIGGSFYYAMRCLQKGAFELPTKEEEVRRLSRNSILAIVGISITFGTVVSIRNSSLYQHGHYTLGSLCLLLLTSISLFTFMLFVHIVYMAISARVSRKYEN